MSDALLTLLRYCFLALLLIFLSRVVLVVVREMRASRPLTAKPRVAEQRERAPRETPRSRTSRGWQVVVVEPPDSAGRRYLLAAENTVGRAPGCTIPIDDNFISSIHVRLFIADGKLFAEDAGSTNGTSINESLITGARPLSRGDRIAIGGTVLEVQR